MTLLAIDPSSTLTGYAVMADRRTILDAGLLGPDKTRDPAIIRIVAMNRSLGKLLREHTPDQIVIETPNAHTAGRIAGRVMGNAIYGFAAGVMFNTCRSHTKTEPVDAQLWTCGVPKLKRTQNVCMAFPTRYNPETDRGGHIADAIRLAVWWFRQQKAKRIAW